MRKFVVLLIALLLLSFGYFFIGNKNVSVIDAHYDGSTAKVIVDRLPLIESEKIIWWKENQNKILEEYNIPTGSKLPFLIVILAFGDGYQVEGKEDRLCFADMKPPKNCIDKKILMMVWHSRDGGVKYQF